MFVYIDTTKDVFLDMIKNNGMESTHDRNRLSIEDQPNIETFDDFNQIINEVENTPYSNFCRDFIEFDF